MLNLGGLDNLVSLSRKLGLNRLEFLLSNRSFLTRRTKPERVRSMIRSLRPQAVNGDLVRLGPPGDGGYLVPDELDGIIACFSPGVSSVSGFERACADRGMRVFMADASVDGPAEFHPNFVFDKKFVGAFSSGEFVTLEDWVAASLGDTEGDLLLQMDIEGFEYETLLGAPSALLGRFRVIVAELHALDQFWNRAFFDLASRALDKLLLTHACVHIHPNNVAPLHRHKGVTIPPLAEFTFVRRELVRSDASARVFPHPLDHDNCDNAPVVLPGIWYRDEA
ncbi:MAG: FkbM family methyltransferase [Gammaproteobacteria bacterium]|nr:FkbM family methyltransferase [Gammaproteobacteria bacterium]